jgi:hypothetical protein
MKRVKFRDGTFGIRRRIWIFWFQYKSLDDRPWWWGRRSEWFTGSCKDTDTAKVNAVWDRLTDAGEPL